MSRASSVLAAADRIGLSRTEAASFIGVSAGTFDAMIARGAMPSPKRIGNRCVWSRNDVESAFNALPSGAPITDGAKAKIVARSSGKRPPWERRA